MAESLAPTPGTRATMGENGRPIRANSSAMRNSVRDGNTRDNNPRNILSASGRL